MFQLYLQYAINTEERIHRTSRYATLPQSPSTPLYLMKGYKDHC